MKAFKSWAPQFSPDKSLQAPYNPSKSTEPFAGGYIFAWFLVLQSVSSMWSDLGAVTGTLAGDSGNVVDLIKTKYEVRIANHIALLKGKYSCITRR